MNPPVDLDDDVAEVLGTAGHEVMIGFACLAYPWRSDAVGGDALSRTRRAGASERSPDPLTKEERITRLVEELAVEYRDLAEPTLIDTEVRSEYERLCRESRVTEFVPILAERTVRDHLNRRFRCQTRSNGGAAPARLRELHH